MCIATLVIPLALFTISILLLVLWTICWFLCAIQKITFIIRISFVSPCNGNYLQVMPLLLREICLPFCIDVVVPLVVYAYTVRWQMPFFFLFIFCHLSSQKWSSIKLDVIVYTHNHFDASHIFIEYNTNGKWMLALPHTLSKRSLSLNTVSRRWNL